MATRYSRPLRSGNAAFARAWLALPALLLLLAAVGLGLVALSGDGPDASPSRVDTAVERPSLPPAA